MLVDYYQSIDSRGNITYEFKINHILTTYKMGFSISMPSEFVSLFHSGFFIRTFKKENSVAEIIEYIKVRESIKIRNNKLNKI